jgi:hypothetical protein
MAYGVIIYENEHDILMDMTSEQVGDIVKNMIRAFRGEEHQHLNSENAYSLTMYKRVSADKDKVVERVIAGSKGGAPKGNTNANKQKQAKTSKAVTETSKTTNNNNNNYNNNNNIGFKPNAFTSGCTNTDYDFDELEKTLIKN